MIILIDEDTTLDARSLSRGLGTLSNAPRCTRLTCSRQSVSFVFQSESLPEFFDSLPIRVVGSLFRDKVEKEKKEKDTRRFSSDRGK